MTNGTAGLPVGDVDVLRELGDWQVAAAASAANRERMAAWQAHDAWAPDRRPMVLFELRNWADGEGPITPADLQCEDGWARGLEQRMRLLRYHVEVLQDDHVVPGDVSFPPAVGRSGFGVPSGRHRETGADPMAFNYTPPLSRLNASDFERLQPRTFAADRAGMARTRERLEAIFGGILPVRLRDAPWQFGTMLTHTALDLVGLDGFMLLMYDNPEGLHRLMAFLRDDDARFYDWLETEGLFPRNDGADYVGAGSMGITRDLPAPDFSGTVRCRDRWGNFNSQESVGISPEQYGEFVFAYMAPLMARFGKVYYGCCEPAHGIWEYLKGQPNLARVSVSPWADEAFMGRACRERRVAYSRKPSPNFISFDRFDEEALLAHFSATARAARGCSLEIIQRDVYTICRKPERMKRWVQLARQACREWSPN